jgi:hypothetical protein
VMQRRQQQQRRRLRHLARAVGAAAFIEQVEAAPEQFTHRGTPMATDKIGELRDSTALISDGEALRERMEADGYLLMRGLLDRPTVQAARLEVLGRLAPILDTENYPLEAGIVRADAEPNGFDPSVTKDNAPMAACLRAGPLIDFFGLLLEDKVRAFDYTWFRVKKPGFGTATTPHSDSIYMGRGAQDCYTVWCPFSDVSFEMGGLMVLEGSYRAARYGEGRRGELMHEYARTDVDGHCATDAASADAIAAAQREGRPLTEEESTAVLSARRAAGMDPGRAELADAHAVLDASVAGARWLTSTFEMGDVLVMSIFTLHASTDNLTQEVRLSSDTRYQRMSEEADARWVGEAAKDNVNPHGIQGVHAKGYHC